MSRRLRLAITAAAGAAACLVPLAAAGSPAASARVLASGRASSGTSWGTAKEVPGLAALNAGGDASLSSVSCASAGNCAAGGYYTDASGHEQAFVVSETGGSWGSARQVPGTAALNVAGLAEVSVVSCTAPGDCAAAGYYAASGSRQQVFAVTETGGTWSTARQLPGSAALNTGGLAQVNSLSCTSAGNCVAGGYYTHGKGAQAAFVASETNGTWAAAEKVPGTGKLNAGGDAAVQSVSCTASGDCSAGGYYASSINDGVPAVQAFVVTQTHGTWGNAAEVPGSAALNGGGYAAVNSVSCTSPGNCGAGGEYTDASPATQAFVVSQVNGTWGTAEEVPGIQGLNVRGYASLDSVSCPSAGNCGAGGYYQDASFSNQAFVVSEVNGTWRTAQEVPGTASLNKGVQALTTSVSCAQAGDCGAGGSYTTRSGSSQAFVVEEVNGTWRTAQEVPGTARLNTAGAAQVTSVSCPSAGHCAAGGYYTNGSASDQKSQAFVVGQG